MDQSVKAHHITSSFEKTGVFPLNPAIAERYRSVHEDVDSAVIMESGKEKNYYTYKRF